MAYTKHVQPITHDQPPDLTQACAGKDPEQIFTRIVVLLLHGGRLALEVYRTIKGYNRPAVSISQVYDNPDQLLPFLRDVLNVDFEHARALPAAEHTTAELAQLDVDPPDPHES